MIPQGLHGQRITQFHAFCPHESRENDQPHVPSCSLQFPPVVSGTTRLTDRYPRIDDLPDSLDRMFNAWEPGDRHGSRQQGGQPDRRYGDDPESIRISCYSYETDEEEEDEVDPMLTFGDDPQSPLGPDKHLGQIETGRRFPASARISSSCTTTKEE